MSDFTEIAIHPSTGRVEKAHFMDDYFGRHRYGVRFPSDGSVWKAKDVRTLAMLSVEEKAALRNDASASGTHTQDAETTK